MIKNELNQQLLEAAVHYDYEGMCRLLANGADFNAVDPENGATIFAEALYQGVSADCLTDMLRLGANPNVAPSVDGTPLIYAVWQLDFGLLQTLLDAGAEPNTPGYIDDDPMTPLDAVYMEYHCKDTEPEHKVIEAMELLLKSRGAKRNSELTAKS